MRGAVPAPNEKPCIPCRSLEAHKANTAIAIKAIPPKKSCGARIHFGKMEFTAPWLEVSLVTLFFLPLILAPRFQGLEAVEALGMFRASCPICPDCESVVLLQTA